MSTAADRLLELNCHLLDLYTEQRLLYREPVAAGAHRGIPVPEPPEYRSLPKPTPRPDAVVLAEALRPEVLPRIFSGPITIR
jgi:hypothetical protein